MIPTKQDAIEATIKWLKDHEPFFPCDQCKFGYRLDEDSKRKCEERRIIEREEHEKWKQKILKWELLLKKETQI